MNLHRSDIPRGTPYVTVRQCDLDDLYSERDRLRAEADKWHQQWVNAHNRMDRLVGALERIANADPEGRFGGSWARDLAKIAREALR